MKAVELFAGAGGLGLGLSLSGFSPVAVVEWDKWACDTMRQNKQRGYPLVARWPIHEGDVRSFAWNELTDKVDLVAGGPPCQPFSMGGKHRSHDDARDMFPATVDIVRRLRPKAFVVENVKGLTRSTFSNYFHYIQYQLEFPELPRRKHEDWFDHFLRLQAEHVSGREHGRGLTYRVTPTLVNAANYGVPQKRERVFIVGFRADLDVSWSFPEHTHSLESLLHAQFVTGEYWDYHRIGKKSRPQVPAKLASQIRRLSQELLPPVHAPWRTLRDALVGLPDPEKTSGGIADHKFQPGARAYPGHTGSPLDLPAKTLKAGDHGVPGGENMMVKDDGTVRYLTLRESARVQTFPDGYVFHGSWTEAMRQLGNAVPVLLAQKVATSVAEELISSELQELAAKVGRNPFGATPSNTTKPRRFA